MAGNGGATVMPQLLPEHTATQQHWCMVTDWHPSPVPARFRAQLYCEHWAGPVGHVCEDCAAHMASWMTVEGELHARCLCPLQLWLDTI